MSLGERIYKLRTEKNLSQGDLADALEVSRQSISKWETNGSVPELDKLVKLSEIFDVSLDELILDKKRAEHANDPEPKVIYVEKTGPSSAQKVAGVILLCFSALLWLMVSLLGDLLAGLILAVPFVACGVICLRARKHAGLWCAWVVYLFIDIYMRYGTGVHWRWVFSPTVYVNEMTVQLIVAWCLLLIFAILTIVTALRTRKAFPCKLRNDLIGTVSGWATYLVAGLMFAFLAREAQNGVVYPQSFVYAAAVFGWVQNIILVVAIVFTIRLVASLIDIRKRNNLRA